MKILLFFLLISGTIFSQSAEFGKLKKKGKFKTYKTKAGNLIKIGDTLTIGLPSAANQFIYITQGNQPTSPILANNKVIISKLKTWGINDLNLKMYALVKGYGALPVYIEYETALIVGELQN